MMKTNPVFYDCEASSLEGVPIEIGWAHVADDGNIVSGSCLVRPAESWRIKDMWDPDAEALHGISLNQLLAEGLASSEIARSLNHVFAGYEFFADDPRDERGSYASSMRLR